MEVSKHKSHLVTIIIIGCLVSAILTSGLAGFFYGYPKGYNRGMRDSAETVLSNVASLLAENGQILDWHLNDDGSFTVTISTPNGSSAEIHFTVHATITFEQYGKIVKQEYHAGSFTKLGLNVTLAKLTGNSTGYNMTQYNLNATYISIGNQGTLDTDSTELPGEWNRTSGLLHDMTYNSVNLTAVIYPDAGPYTADCMGVNIEDGIGNGALLCYDTFSESTGIDDSYTITIEFKISVI